jgi:methylmalonyl-CoA/ethylmalonyl-CoA epimerase
MAAEDPTRSHPRLDHAAFLVPDLDRALERLASRGLAGDGVREYSKEGTRESYVGGGAGAGRLLLIQAVGPGPYERALAKRGPGLHHVALAVPSLAGFARGLAHGGWLVHPWSFRNGPALSDLWLCRHGVGALIEILEDPPPAAGGARPGTFVTRVGLPVEPGRESLLESLGCPSLRPASAGVPVLDTLSGNLPCGLFA